MIQLSNPKHFFTTAAVYTILLIVFTVILLVDSCHHIEMAKEDAQIEKIKESPVTRYTDVNGNHHAEKQVVVADVAVVKAHYQAIIDSLLRVVRTKPKNIKGIVKAGTITQGSFTPEFDYGQSNINKTFSDHTMTLEALIPKTDSNKRDYTMTIDSWKGNTTPLYIDADTTLSIHFEDKWLSIDGSLTDKPWTYSIRDSLTFVSYYKKKGLFKKQLVLNAYSANPNTTITGLTAIDIAQPKPKRIGIGLQAGYYYTGKAFVPAAGIGITYNIIRF